MSSEVLAIIPARGGSKGIPGKNIKSIAGKPLIAWSIEQALSSQGVSRVVVSTDCPDIADIARHWGAEVPFLRPAELAVDTAATEPSLIHALAWLEEHEHYVPSEVLLLQATSPVRDRGQIDAALAKFYASQADSLLSVCPFWHFLWRGRDKPQAEYDFEHRPRRQDIPASDIRFKENGSLYISKRAGLLQHQNRLFGDIALFEMSDLESFEIDTLEDWLVVEAILNGKST